MIKIQDLKHSSITIGTLAMHIGIALEKEVIAFIGPTSQWEIELFGKREKILADVPRVCCYLPDCEVSPACNEKNYSEEILDYVREALERRKKG